MGGQLWVNSTNWGDETVSYCEWHGIDCDNSSPRNVNIISLKGNNLVGTFPAELGQFTTVKVLILDDNSLTGTLPTTIGILKDLEYFSISGNLLTGIVPDEICSLTEENGGFLQTLDVDCDNLGGSVTCDCCLYC